MFPFTDNHCPYTPLWLHLWCGLNPYVIPDSSFIVLQCITNIYSHDITLPLFLLIHLSHDPTFCLLIIPTLFIAFVSPSAQITHRLRQHSGPDPYDITYDVMTTPVYKVSKCGNLPPNFDTLGSPLPFCALVCLRSSQSLTSNSSVYPLLSTS